MTTHAPISFVLIPDRWFLIPRSLAASSKV